MQAAEDIIARGACSGDTELALRVGMLCARAIMLALFEVADAIDHVGR